MLNNYGVITRPRMVMATMVNLNFLIHAKIFGTKDNRFEKNTLKLPSSSTRF